MEINDENVSFGKCALVIMVPKPTVNNLSQHFAELFLLKQKIVFLFHYFV